MTLAICIKCGAEKNSVFSPCGECGFLPTDALDRAKGFVLSTHELPAGELRGLAGQIRAGEEPDLPQEKVDKFLRGLEANVAVQSEATSSGCTSDIAVLLGYGAILAVVFLLVPLGFVAVDRVIGPRSLDTGTVSDIKLVTGDGSPLIGKTVTVFSDFIRVENDDDHYTWIPREHVERLELQR